MTMAATIADDRALQRPTACEIALKVKETSYAMAEPFSPADFLHGPVAMLDEKLPLFLVAPSSKVSDDLDQILQLGRERKAGIASNRSLIQLPRATTSTSAALFTVPTRIVPRRASARS